MSLPNFDINYSLLDCYENSCKLYSKRIKYNKILISLCILLICYYTVRTIMSIYNWNVIFDIILLVIWLINILLNKKQLKNNKIKLKDNQDLYENALKIVDYPKYIKDQRVKKLKQLKKG